jgi:hypothetical protein
MQTLEEIEAAPKALLAPGDISEYLQIDAQAFRIQAREDKKNRTDSFGFPVIVIGNRVKIPKEPFVKFMKGEKQMDVQR